MATNGAQSVMGSNLASVTVDRPLSCQSQQCALAARTLRANLEASFVLTQDDWDFRVTSHASLRTFSRSAGTSIVAKRRLFPSMKLRMSVIAHPCIKIDEFLDNARDSKRRQDRKSGAIEEIRLTALRAESRSKRRTRDTDIRSFDAEGYLSRISSMPPIFLSCVFLNRGHCRGIRRR